MRATLAALVVYVRAHRRRQKQLALLLRARMLVRERNVLNCASLINPIQSPWHVLYNSRDRGSYISTVWVHPEAFELLLQVFSQYYTVRSGIGKRGRPPKFMFKHAVLGCLLHSYTAAVEQKTLCEIFGVPPSTLSRVMYNAERALLKALRVLPDAKVVYPSKAKQIQWSRLTEAKEPRVKGVWGFIDGKNYRVQAPTDSELQNASYNGWLHSVLVTGTFCWVDGTIVWGRHNCPGSWNDGETSRQFQLKLNDPSITVPGTGVAADSAFPVLGGDCGKVVTPLKTGDLERAAPELRTGMVVLSNAVTSLRQAAEWGMGAPSKCYRILMLPLPFDKDKRGQLLEVVMRLYNFRTRQTGISQIRNVF
jgi:hypothetical protein